MANKIKGSAPKGSKIKITQATNNKSKGSIKIKAPRGSKVIITKKG